MTVSLYIALGYLFLTTAILLLNRRDFQLLESLPDNYFDRQAPSVSICIPARNEAACIERCVRTAVAQEYPKSHVYVLDDESTDGTAEIIAGLKNKFSEQLTILNGRPKPGDWLGKPWACQQLAEASDGEILLFIDADTWLEPTSVAKTVRTMGRDVLDFITLWPHQELGSFWEKVVIPLIYQALLTHLPVRYVRHPPQWLPSFLQKSLAHLFAAACGQFMAFKRGTYETIGGHRSVKYLVVEDVALAKKIKGQGFAMNMYDGRQTVSCRMYRSHQALWSGLRKNFLAGFSYNIFLFIVVGLLHFIAYLFPVLLLPFLSWSLSISMILVMAVAAVLLMLNQRRLINRWFGWNAAYCLLHPLGVAWFQLLGLQVLKDFYSGKRPQWKGRKV